LKIFVKNLLKETIRLIVLIFVKGRIGRYIESVIINSVVNRCIPIVHKGLSLKFYAPNDLCRYRCTTFSTKEPETLEWIDLMPRDSILWDIGANVGLYSIYAAKKINAKVWAFEPSVFNLNLLARNIFLNELTNNICIVPLPLSDKIGASKMHMPSIESGGALSTFGELYGWDGKPILQVFEFQTIGVSMDDALKMLFISKPDFIKMDVDGIEHLILSGGQEVLNTVKGVLIEINDAFFQQSSESQLLLKKAGLIFQAKRQSAIVASSTLGFQNAYNQIWIRP
jgi:FkbM family methyltransferase